MALAHDVVARQPDVIVVNFNPLVAVFKRATSTIPITGIVADPIRSGLVANLARPGGNLTGVSVDAGLEIYGKRLQLLKELIPSTARVAYLGTEVEWDGVGGQELREASRHLLIALTSMQPKPVSPGELRRVFDEVSRTGVDALLVSPSGDFLAHRRLIVELADSSRLPTMYAFRDFVEVGGLVAYGSDAVEMAVRLADQVHHVLTGASPGEIPFHQVTGFELVINRRTANALGLEIPPALLARADEVIE
jgi:putative tryptophan/tyrosine transport system substrate-binding protein